MKKKTILILLAVLVCLSGVVVRIWYVNQGREERVIKIYPMGEMGRPLKMTFTISQGKSGKNMRFA